MSSTTTINTASNHASAKRPARRMIALGAPLAFLALAAPMAQAEPWFRISFGDKGKWRGRHEPVRPPVVIRPVIRSEHHRPVEVLPCDLRFTAYQTGNTVLIFATGENRSAGFTTCLSIRDDGRSPAVTLRNTSPFDQCAAQMTRFDVSGSFEARHCLSSITVHAAGQCFEVPVSQVQRLS